MNPAPTSPLAPSARRRGLFFLAIASAGVGFAITLQLGLNSNFVGQTMQLSGEQQGLLEAARESCGVIALLILALLARFAEPIIGALMLLLFAVGLSTNAYLQPGHFGYLVLASLVWSQGLHVWMPLPNSMTLALAEPGRAGHRLGQVQSAGAIGSALGLAVALALTLANVRISHLWLVGGAAAVLAAAACLGIPKNLKTPGPRIVFRWRYKLYYVLCFLEGWRKQIPIAFAGFLLVKQYHTPLTTMLLLWLAIQAIGYLSSPPVGRLIDRVGERPILIFYYTSLTLFFIAYAFVQHPWLLYAIFIIDSAFFVFAMALTTIVNRLVPPSEHTPTLSLGVAINHVAAVTMPLLGGLAWNHLGYRWTFLIGAITAALSILVACRIPKKAASIPTETLEPAAALTEV